MKAPKRIDDVAFLAQVSDLGRYNLSRYVRSVIDSDPTRTWWPKQIRRALGLPPGRRTRIAKTLRYLHRTGWIGRRADGRFFSLIVGYRKPESREETR